MPNFYDLLQEFPEFTEERLVGYIEAYPEPEENIGQRFLPTEETYDINYHVQQIESYRTMAYLVNYDTEAPVKGPGRMREISGRIPLIKHKTMITEAEMYNFFNRRINDKKYKENMKNKLYGMVDGLLEGIQDVYEWLRWQVLAHGRLDYNKFGLKLSVDFGIEQKVTLTGTDLFSDPNSTPWDFLREQLKTYKSKNKGREPDVMVGSMEIFFALQGHPQTKSMLSLDGDRPASPEEMDTLFKLMGLPPFIVYDKEVYWEDPDNPGNQNFIINERLIPEERLLFLAEHKEIAGKEVGKLLVGPVREANWEPRIAIKAYDNLDDDAHPSAGFKGVGSAMPALFVPSTIAQFDVL
ncbi:hypothetical protein BBF96_03480 [Anoxybacter fermentans]|uniref:Major capsid protein E n=1 Tax=Anoxybacter fermentans TaxID=1323375 RepID=A0A3S9SW64_9FIRM|nr:major capsid protein [Anoxybacter fermentans]AZR72524.1 hypothetical protein BBF96_03480 [Anoxybacter fermentans]